MLRLFVSNPTIAGGKLNGRMYMAGPRSFPTLINQLAGLTDTGWDGLGTYERPFLTVWGGND